VEDDSDVSQERDSSDEDSDYYDREFNVENDDFFFEHLNSTRKKMTRISKDFSKPEEQLKKTEEFSHQSHSSSGRHDVIDQETILQLLTQETEVTQGEWKRMVEKSRQQLHS
jgi:hypothetical protein